MNLIISKKSPNPETVVISIEGEIDVYTSTQLREVLTESENSGVKLIVINLAKVEYLDSTGLGILIGALKRLRENDGNIIVVSPSVRIMRVFEITGLVKIFTIYPTEAEASAAEGIVL